MTDADIGQLRLTQDWLRNEMCPACMGTGEKETNLPTYLCPVCLGTGKQDRKADMVAVRNAMRPYTRGNDPGPGRIDAVNTADAWRDTVSSYTQDAADDAEYAALLAAADRMTTEELVDLLPAHDEPHDGPCLCHGYPRFDCPNEGAS